MPSIILVVHFGLDSSIEDYYSSKHLLDIRVIEGLTSMTNIVKELLPLINVVS